jgi:hypothetical protein
MLFYFIGQNHENFKGKSHFYFVLFIGGQSCYRMASPSADPVDRRRLNSNHLFLRALFVTQKRFIAIA